MKFSAKKRNSVSISCQLFLNRISTLITDVLSTLICQRYINFHIQPWINVDSTWKNDVESTLIQRWFACWVIQTKWDVFVKQLALLSLLQNSSEMFFQQLKQLITLIKTAYLYFLGWEIGKRGFDSS